MNITLHRSDYEMATEIRAEYFDTNGRRKYMSKKVANYPFDNGHYRDCVNYAKEELRARVRDDIMRSAREGGERMPTTANTYWQTGEVMMSQDMAMASGTATMRYATIDNGTTAPMYWTTTNSDGATWTQINPICNDIDDFNRKNQKIKVNLKIGKRVLEIEKDLNDSGILELGEADVQKAKDKYISKCRFNIRVRKAERKSEDLLKMFVSELDFRNYKENGFFVIKSGNRIFRVHRDSHKMIDVWQRGKGGILLPENRLCVHTPTREIPPADEALAKLMLIRSGKVFDRSNKHGIGNLLNTREKELVLV